MQGIKNKKNLLDIKNEHSMYYCNTTNNIDYRKIFYTLWNGKWWVIIITLIFAISSVIIALCLPNIYKSEVLVVPTENNREDQISSMLGQFGGAASLMGINLDGVGVSKTVYALQTLKSRRFINKFTKKHNLIVPIMASEGWDPQKNKLKIDTNKYNEDTKKWVRKVEFPFVSKPSPQEVYKKFIENNLKIIRNKENGTIKIDISFYSPNMAKQWLEWLLADINEEIRNSDMLDAEKSIEYLNRQLRQTSLAENRTMLYQLIEQKTKTLMLTQVKDEYMFKTVDPAISPLRKDRPKRALICIIITFLGGVISLLFVLTKEFIKDRKYLDD